MSFQNAYNTLQEFFGDMSKYRFGGYFFDTVSGSLHFDGQTSVLRPKIADLLLALVESAPEVVSKEDLIARVWPDTAVAESGLARNINELRSLLTREPAAIETIPKRGYRFTIPVESGEVRSDTPPEKRKYASRRLVLTAAGVAVLLSSALLLLMARDRSGLGQPSVPVEPAAREIAVRREFQLGYQNWGLWDEQSMQQALVHFRRAGRLDPDLWYGYVGIAESYLGLLLLTGRMDLEWIQWARDGANRAVRLAPKVAVSHTAAADVRLIADWDWDGAEKSLQRALECNAFNYTAYQHRGILRTLQGRFEEARTDLRKARELQPEHSDPQVFSAWVEFCARDFDRAIAVLADLPNNPGKRRQSLRVLTAAYGMKRDFQRARKALANAGLSKMDHLRAQAWLDAREGNIRAAELRLAELRAVCAGDSQLYCDTAIVEAALGQTDKAFASLDQGIKLRHWNVLMLAIDPRLEALHGDPRWQALCERVRNPVRREPGRG